MKTTYFAVLSLLVGALTFGGIPAGAHALPAVATPVAPAPAESPADLPSTPAALDPAESVPAEITAQPDSAVPEPTAAPRTEAPSTPAEPSVEKMAVEPSAEATAAEPSVEATEPADEEGFVPVGAGHALPGPNTPLITAPDGSIQSAVESHEPDAADAQGRRIAAPVAAPTRSGDIKVTLVTATLADDRRGINVQAAQNAIGTTSSYWKSMSNNRLSMSVAATRSHTSSARSTDDFTVMMNTISREIGWRDSPYTALVVFVPAAELRSGGYGGILGGGWSANNTGGRILMPAPSLFTPNVVAHEFGHVLGLMHANSLQCTNGRADVGINASSRWADSACSTREYGDTLDLMGTAQYKLPVINSLFWDLGGFGRGNEVRDGGTVSGSRTYTLTAWAGTEANRAVKFKDPVSDEVYYLELRLPVGNDATAAVGGNRGVKIVKRDLVSWGTASVVIPPSTRPFAGYYNANHTWQAGQTFTTHGGTTVTINSMNATSASVTVQPKTQTGNVYFKTDPVTATAFGTPGDQFLSCDWDGDGVATPATFRRGVWTMRDSLDGSSSRPTFSFGATGDQPICGDWDGDGKQTVGVYRNGTVYLRNSNSNGSVDRMLYFGAAGDVAIAGDWDGDGSDTLGVTRREGVAKRFFLTNSSIAPNVHGSFLLGNSTDTPIAGDWNRDGYATVGVKRGNVWYFSNSNLRGSVDQSFKFGNPGDTPLTGEWSQNGPTGVGVVR